MKFIRKILSKPKYLKNAVSVFIICMFIGFSFFCSYTYIPDTTVPLSGENIETPGENENPEVEPTTEPGQDTGGSSESGESGETGEPSESEETGESGENGEKGGTSGTDVVNPDNNTESGETTGKEGEQSGGTLDNGTTIEGENKDSAKNDITKEDGSKSTKSNTNSSEDDDSKTTEKDDTTKVDKKTCEHEWMYTPNNDGTHTTTCAKCGEESTAACEFDENGKCTICGYEKEKEKCEHEWRYTSNEDGTHTKKCTKCHEEQDETCEFDENGKCKHCGYIDPEKCTHEFTYFSNKDGTHTKICSLCGFNETEDCEFDAKGVCPLCGYINEKTEFANVEELKAATLSEGLVVHTLGYYSEGDGGAGEYTIYKKAQISPNNGTCIQIANGYAVLNGSDFVNIKQFGARGDGSTDDSAILQKMLDLKYDIIRIPRGQYAFNGKMFDLNRHITLEGDGNATLVDVGFNAPYGITTNNLHFNGGGKSSFSDIGGSVFKGPINFLIRPANSSCYVSYNSCSFRDVQFVSLMCGTQTIASDSAINCNFTNISRVALYHSMNIGTSTYIGNKFSRIGQTSIMDGPVSAIWIGDVTNITKTESKNVTIESNTFNDLYTADDISDSSHVLNANFICVRARRATINGNTVSNVHGYGQDRESVYTKVCYLNVTNNTITNGGYGEGYITCKGQDGLDAFAVITGNKLLGTYGSGIYLYGAGQIKNNNISITNCRTAVVTHVRNCATNKAVSVSGNTINCNPGNLYIKGKLMEAHQSTSLVSIDASQCPVNVQGNSIYTDGSALPLKNIIKVSNVAHNLTITGNKIIARAPVEMAIGISSNATYWSSNRNSTITCSNNNIETPDMAIQIIYKNPNGKVSGRQFKIENNKLNGSSTARYGIYICTNGGTNNDKLTYSSIQEKNYLSNHVYTNMKSISTTSQYITQAK